MLAQRRKPFSIPLISKMQFKCLTEQFCSLQGVQWNLFPGKCGQDRILTFLLHYWSLRAKSHATLNAPPVLTSLHIYFALNISNFKKPIQITSALGACEMIRQEFNHFLLCCSFFGENRDFPPYGNMSTRDRVFL